MSTIGTKSQLDKIIEELLSAISLLEILRNSCEFKDLANEYLTLEITLSKINKVSEIIIDELCT